MTQPETVLEHLRTEGSISKVEALIVHNIPYLPQPIHFLRRDGYDIVGTRSRDKTGTRYTRYTLAEA